MARKEAYEKIEDIWESIRNRGYYIVGFALLLFFPSILGVTGFSKLPILSDIYSLGRNNGLFGPNTWVLKIVSLCAIWAIFAASWDFLSGYTGQISFGHAIFWGMSAYITYWTAVEIGLPFNELEIPIFDELAEFLAFFLNTIIKWLMETLGANPFVINPPVFRAILMGASISALFAVFIGTIALRVKGPYLALITLILPLIASRLVLVFSDITGGNWGYSFIVEPYIIEKAFPVNRELDGLNFYIFAILVFIILFGIMMLIAYSRIGLAFQSVREDEEAAESLGIHVSFYKIVAFTGSAFFAGLAGSIYAQHPIIRSTGPSFFDATFSFSIIIFCVIGGLGSISGGAIGAFLMTILLNLFLNDIFHDIAGLDIFVYAILLIITLRYMPYGLVRATKDQKRACIVGTLFALSWILLPIREGWGVELFSNLLPNVSGTPPNGDILSALTSIFSNSVLTLVGKFDLLGQMLFSLTPDNFLYFVSLLAMLIFSIPAMLIFLISEVFGLLILQEILGLSLASSTLIKAKFIIYVAIGIPFAFYFPKIFRYIRLKYWGVWPSAGRYEPE